jgi:putative spermidine/putrescine transport system ATP-binding protein
MSVEHNIASGLAARGAPPETVASTVDRMIELVHLGAMRTRFPRELSGGQQQRVALARALSISPSILLLDEPFGALDKNLRLDMQFEIRRLQRELGITTILVTHDQEEAMSMADRIAVMHQGTIEQLASPVEIYDKPATVFVNTFVGTANLLEGKIDQTSEQTAVFQVPGAGAIRVPARREIGKDASALLSVRPENFEIREAEQNSLRGRVRVGIPLGAMTVYEIELGGGQVVKVTAPRHAESVIYRDGDEIGLGLRSEAATSLFAGRA